MKKLFLCLFLCFSNLYNTECDENSIRRIMSLLAGTGEPCLESSNESLLNAVVENDIKSATSLIASGADVNYVDKDNYYSKLPLIAIAISGGSLAMVELLVEKGVNLDVPYGNCFELCSITPVEGGLKRGVLIDPLTQAIYCGQIEIAKFLLLLPLRNSENDNSIISAFRKQIQEEQHKNAEEKKK